MHFLHYFNFCFQSGILISGIVSSPRIPGQDSSTIRVGEILMFRWLNKGLQTFLPFCSASLDSLSAILLLSICRTVLWKVNLRPDLPLGSMALITLGASCGSLCFWLRSSHDLDIDRAGGVVCLSLDRTHRSDFHQTLFRLLKILITSRWAVPGGFQGDGNGLKVKCGINQLLNQPDARLGLVEGVHLLKIKFYCFLKIPPQSLADHPEHSWFRNHLAKLDLY